MWISHRFILHVHRHWTPNFEIIFEHFILYKLEILYLSTWKYSFVKTCWPSGSVSAGQAPLCGLLIWHTYSTTFLPSSCVTVWRVSPWRWTQTCDPVMCFFLELSLNCWYWKLLHGKCRRVALHSSRHMWSFPLYELPNIMWSRWSFSWRYIFFIQPPHVLYVQYEALLHQ